MPLAAGQTLPFYDILGPLGAGAMGEVYRARDTRLEREVAIKILPEPFAVDAERLRRFEGEAKSLASLNHSNVGQIFGVDQVGDSCFLVLELVPGETLEERIERGVPVDEAVSVDPSVIPFDPESEEAGPPRELLRRTGAELRLIPPDSPIPVALQSFAVASDGTALYYGAERVDSSIWMVERGD